MEAEDRARIEKIIRDRRLANEALLASGSRTYQAFLDMEAAALEYHCGTGEAASGQRGATGGQDPRGGADR